MRHGFLHHPRTFHHLRQKHFAGTKEVADNIHAVHQRSFNDLDGFSQLFIGFLTVLHNIFINAVHQGVFQAFFHAFFTPEFGSFFILFFTDNGSRHLQQTLTGIFATIKNHIFNRFTQFFINVLVHQQFPGIDDGHIHARLDGVIQKYRMHGFTQGIIATK